jgi:acetyltransferase
MSEAKRPKSDPAHDVLRDVHRSLEAIFAPKSVAVVGATETMGSVGRTILWNLVSSPFGGTVYPVNPKRPSVLGIRTHPSIAEVPDHLDLAVIVTPAAAVPGVIAECVDHGVRGAIIISAGFKEMGKSGEALEAEILTHARRGQMRIIGPNCLGVMNPLTGLNATFARGIARPGRIAFVSQSGALLTAILDWSLREQVGFSSFVSIGSMLDVGWGDLIDFLGSDPRTQAILLYMESIGDARAFLSAAREVALSKPIIVIKAGRTSAAAKAAASHTGTLTGSDEVLDAAFRRAGVLRVDSIDALFNMAEVLSKQPRPKGPRLTIVTNAGGPGVLATDALIEAGGQLAELSPETHAKLSEILPAAWSRNNPVDILGDATPDRYKKALEIAAKDPKSDGMLVILTPQDMTDPTITAEALRTMPATEDKPLLASWMGGPFVRAGEDILNAAGVPTFGYPDTAAKAFAAMWRYAQNLEELYETPMPIAGEERVDRAAAESIITEVLKDGRTLLDEVESKRLLAAYGLPVVPTFVAKNESEAVAHAEAIGYPVVLKIYSRTLTHKTDVGGVLLDLADASSVQAAFVQIRRSVEERAGAQHFLGCTVQPMIRLEGYELILGSSVDPQFGPVLLFGQGGQLVEVLKDRALGLPPLTGTLARRMISETRISKALRGVRGRPPVDQRALEELLVRFGQLVTEQPWVSECDLNPLLVSHERAIAVDARVVLHDPKTPKERLPRPAIRPYPIQYVHRSTLKDGTPVIIRPIQPEDEPAMVRFHQVLSERTVWLRYFHPLKYDQRIAHQRLIRVCFNDYDRELALVVELDRPGQKEIIAVGRLSKLPGRSEGEFAILVSDQYQGQGLGSRLLADLVHIGKDEGLARITADILPENVEMQAVSRKLKFSLEPRLEERRVIARLDLRA